MTQVTSTSLAAGGPNLARRPFTNQRPVKRISWLLVILGLVLLLVDLWLYTGYVTTRRANATELTEIEASIVAERQAMDTAARRLDGAEVAQQNELVGFINQRIAERTFGWSVLFDRLAYLLPQDVRLTSLAPTFGTSEEPRRRARTAAQRDALPPGRTVELRISALARQDEALLEFLDALFADPAFRNPNLAREAKQASGEVEFQLSVTYLPQEAEALAAQVRAAEAMADGRVVLDESGDVKAEVSP